MLRGMQGQRFTAFIILGVLLTAPHLTAQWIKYPTGGVPRKTDGSVNMTAPVPRLADGKPDLSGIWTTAEPSNQSQNAKDADAPGDPGAIRASRQMANIGVDIPGGLPYQPWLVPIVKKRTDNQAIEDPHIR